MPLKNFRGYFLLIVSLLIRVSPVFCQEYNYSNIDVRDGLAGSTVYIMVQDKEGFMWFGTETGLSRYDGTHFKNFYASDGLPDNEILDLFVDSRNRVWITPFKNSICYYWKGRIHNKENDSLIRQLKNITEVISVHEDSHGNILILDSHILYFITPEGKVLSINKFEGSPITIRSVKAGLDRNGNFDLVMTLAKNLYFLARVNLQKLVLEKESDEMVPVNSSPVYLSPQVEVIIHPDLCRLIYPEYDTSFIFPPLQGFINVSEIDDSTITFNTNSGAYLLNIHTKKITDSFLRHQPVNSVTRDMEGSLWFSVFGKGVYRLSSGSFLTYSDGQQDKSVFCIEKFDSVIYAGSDNFYLWMLNIKKRKIEARQIWKGASRGRITSLINAGNHTIIAGTDNGIFRIRDFILLDSFNYLSVKSILPEQPGKMLVSSGQGTLIISTTDFKSQDKIWRDRATCAYKMDGIYYIGTLNGLYTVGKNRKINYLGDSEKVFQNRINAIGGSENGTIWVATNGTGIVAYKNNKIVAGIMEKDGLTSNNCRNIFITENAVWVGTDKGLDKISLSASGFGITPYGSMDGLSSDIINSVYADGSNIYVGTPEGLTYFDETKISKRSICNLQITSILISGMEMPTDSSDFEMKHRDNNIRFQFAGISYKSASSISYQYRLVGLDTSWKTTTEGSLNYQALPSGKYEFQLKAINKFGVHSKLLRIRFQIAKTLFEKTWFRVLTAGLVIILLWLLINSRIRAIKNKIHEKSDTVKRMAELEQMALKSQMNPHFIFNCLNSIQHYVIDKDILGANQFISNFSRLIRLTLDYSSKADICLADEIDYITTYMELEQKRFEDKFTFEVSSGDIVRKDYFIPPMILQPYIENAIRHGLRYRDDGQGKILVKMEKSSSYLTCFIIDNGIGRMRAGQYKSKTPIEYQSKGMELTAKRIQMFNQFQGVKITIKINDLEDSNHEPAGTEVIIQFPLKEADKDNTPK